MKSLVWGKNDKVNALETLAMESHKVVAQIAATHRDSNDMLAHAPTITHKNQKPPWTAEQGPRASGAPPGPQTITHNDKKIALVLFLASGFAI